MAIYHLSVSVISRGKGRSIIGAAAYCTASRLVDQRTGLIHDFRQKEGVLHSEILLPEGAPPWACDRETVWNQAEKAEDASTRRATATTGREFKFALSAELSEADRLAATRDFAAYIVRTLGVVADFSIHAPDRQGDERNFHVHLLISDRAIAPTGFSTKVRHLNIANGGRKAIREIRERWEEIANRHLEAAGIEHRIDCRSNADRGVDDTPSIHLGPLASGMERQGKTSERAERNREIKARNASRKRTMTAEKKVYRSSSEMLATAKA